LVLLWGKDNDEIDPETGLTTPTVIHETETKIWLKDGKFHRDEIDPDTGLTLSPHFYVNGEEVYYILLYELIKIF
jgi:hypothetical protein